MTTDRDIATPVVSVIGIGANLGDPLAQIDSAFDSLERLDESTLLRRSSIFRSAPMGASGQPDYFNAVAVLETTQSARGLLDALLDIESRHGRHRSFPNAPRTLDLDLLLHGELVVDEPGMTVPHPRMHLRRFVLAPLLEVLPEAHIPGRGPVRDLLGSTLDQRVLRL